MYIYIPNLAIGIFGIVNVLQADLVEPLYKRVDKFLKKQIVGDFVPHI